MTVWNKIESDDCYAVAIYNFTPSNTTAPYLSLDVGELVKIERETDQWYWGRSLRKPTEGAFPRNLVVLRPCCVHKCGDTIVASAGSCGVTHDISVTLKEWAQQWKQLFVNNSVERFKFMEVSMRALLEIRAQLTSAALPQDQLRKLARTAVFTIDKGNRALGMELAVRNSNGQLVNPLKVSTYKLNAMYADTNARIDKNMETTPSPPPQSSPVRGYSIVVRVHNFVCRIAEACDLLIALHDSSGNKLTDHLILRWPPPNLNTSNMQVVFTDLGSDIKKDKLFLVCHVIRIGSMEQQSVDVRRSSVQPTPVQSTTNSLRRPFGVACLDISQRLNSNKYTVDAHVQLPFFPCEKEYLESLLKRLTSMRDLKDAKQSQGLWVSLQLVEGDLKQMREQNPHLVVGHVAIARKMGFPEVILPGEFRNDLYVSLCCGSYSRQGVKSSERNIELCARVVDKNGKTLKGVISVGEGMPRVDEYTSLVYYHDDKPRWMEVFKVCLKIDTFKEAHLVFLSRHRSSNEAKDKAEKYFAISYLRLMQSNGTTTPDKQHNLCVYKIDNKRGGQQSEIEAEASAVCLGLPSKKDELPSGAERGLIKGLLSLVHKDYLTVTTGLCSTKLTQREEILGVLKWNTHHSEGTLRNALINLLQVPSEELVKFLQDILDALFNILTQVREENEKYTEESYGILVLDGLMRVISLVGDHKYHHFQPILNLYIDTSFCDALAYEELISVIVWVIRSAERGELAIKRLLQCMKCLEWLVRIIVRSRELRRELGDHDNDHDFRFRLENLLDAIIWLMRCGDPALTCQGMALKYLPAAVSHIMRVYPEADLSVYIVRALEALPMRRLSKQRVLALLELTRGPFCKSPAARRTLLPHIAVTLRDLLKDNSELERDAHKSRSVDKAARLLGADTSRLQDYTNLTQIVDLCVEVMGEMLTLLARDDVGPVDSDKGEIVKRLLPTVLTGANNMMRDREDKDEGLLRRMLCVLLDMVRQMSEEQYLQVVKSLESEKSGGGTSLVCVALSLLQQVLQQPVFKQHWSDMLLLQHYVMVHALRLLSKTLHERLSIVDYDSEELTNVHNLCRQWFICTATVATSPCLQWENLTAQQRQRVTSLFGHIRRRTAEMMRDMWFNLGDHKRAFIPCLVGPFLEVSFLRDEELRNTTIPLFFDMMQTEYNHNIMAGESGEGHLKELESELIDKVDVLAESGQGDVQWRAKFVSLCGALCQVAPTGVKTAGAELVAAAARQLDALLQYREAARKASTAHKMHLTTRVLDFYKQIERPHMYIRYVHKLAEMHRTAGQQCEAGLCLRLHATLLPWTSDPLPDRLRLPVQDDERQCATSRELKEALYIEVAELLKQGRQWELAIDAIKELVCVYEEELLGYAKLAALHDQLAKLYSDILRTPREHPYYFRVIYYGKGFPEHLRVPNGFIYRGNEYEKLQDFNDRMLDEWPEAEILTRLDTPGEEIINSDKQYLQINAVEPVLGDKLKRLSGKPVAPQILQYYKHNNVDKFTFSRPFHRQEESLNGSSDDLSSNEFATRWLERTELEISEKLPGILRWFPVVRKRTFWVSPVEAAVEALREGNRLLRSLVLEASVPTAPLQPLTMRLNGILDPAVQGGIVNYEKAFLTPEYEAAHPEHVPLLNELKSLIADQIPLLKYGLEVHGARAPPALEALHEHMMGCFRRIRHHVAQRYGLRSGDAETESEVQLRMNLRDSLQPEAINLNHHRMSDISTGNDSGTRSKFFSSFNSAINPLARTSNSGVANYFTLKESPKRREKRRARKSELPSGSGSQWYTSSTPNGSVNSVAASPISTNTSQPDLQHGVSPLRELRQELVTERPLRAEVERERRLSQRTSFLTNSAPPSNRDSVGTTDSNQDEEEPPPLPEKSHRHTDIDTENNNTPETTPLQPRYSYDTVISPRGSFLYNSMVSRRNTSSNTELIPPTPPPKKKNLNSIT